MVFPDIGARYLSALLLSLLLVSGCSSDPESPEDQVRTLLAEAEAAVEARSIKDAAALVSETYQDQYRNNKRVIVRLLLGTFHRHQNIHLLTRIHTLEIAADGQVADTVVYAAMAGMPLESAEALVSVNASLYRFDLTLNREEDGWRLVQAAWRRAQAADFLP